MFVFGALLLQLCLNIVASPECPILIPAPADHCFERIDPESKAPTQITMLVLHYTACSLAQTLQIFLGASRQVTSHYTISEEGIVFKHASENFAARHAGASYWQGKTALNLYAVGIEHVNEGRKAHDGQSAGIVVSGSEEQWYQFDERQIVVSMDLCKRIIERYKISPENIVGHSDIAPGRKMDPGPLFPWYKFANYGIGAWPDAKNEHVLSCFKLAIEKGHILDWVITHLHLWGYKLPDGMSSEHDIIRAFQMHFRPSNISGHADRETAEVLHALFCKYKVIKGSNCSCGM